MYNHILSALIHAIVDMTGHSLANTKMCQIGDPFQWNLLRPDYKDAIDNINTKMYVSWWAERRYFTELINVNVIHILCWAFSR